MNFLSLIEYIKQNVPDLENYNIFQSEGNVFWLKKDLPAITDVITFMGANYEVSSYGLHSSFLLREVYTTPELRGYKIDFYNQVMIGNYVCGGDRTIFESLRPHKEAGESTKLAFSKYLTSQDSEVILERTILEINAIFDTIKETFYV